MKAISTLETIHPYIFNPQSHEAAELIQLCAAAYGPSLAPPDQFQRRMQRVTTLITVRHYSGVLAGAVALQRSRMTTFAVSPDKALGDRRQMVQVLGDASRQSGMEWCTIGGGHIAMLATASRLQLERVTDRSHIETLLEKDRLADAFIIGQDNCHLPVVTTHSSVERQRPYPQQVWARSSENSFGGAPTTIRT